MDALWNMEYTEWIMRSGDVEGLSMNREEDKYPKSIEAWKGN